MKKLLLIEPPSPASRAQGIAQAGYEVETVTDHANVEDSLHRFNPHLVLLDCELPGLSPIQFFAQLRSQPETQFLPVIALARAKDSVMAQTLRMAGANQVLDKHKLSESALLNAVRENTPSWVFQVPRPDIATPAAPAASIPAKPTAAPQPERAAAPVRLPSMAKHQKLTLELLKAARPEEQLKAVRELQRETQKVIESGVVPVESLTAATLRSLAALLQAMADHPRTITATTCRTLYQTVYLLTPLPALQLTRCYTATNRYRILTVDDDDVLRGLLVETLRPTGLAIENAAEPKVALELVRRLHLDLFILDVTMPEMDGYELCAKLRRLPNHAQTPVLFLTGNNDMDHRMRFAQTGADDFIAKPFHPQELTAKTLGHLLISQMRLEEQSPTNS